MRRTLVVVAPLLLAACVHTPPTPPAQPAPPPRDGKVSYELIPTGGAGEYHLEKNQSTYGAQLVKNDPPAYPPALIAQNLPPAVVHAKVIVDTEGKVSEVRDLDTAGDPSHAAFLSATRDAAMHWSYTPMTMVDEEEDAKGKITEKKHNAPFSLDYAFRFELKDGVPTVTATH